MRFPKFRAPMGGYCGMGPIAMGKHIPSPKAMEAAIRQQPAARLALVSSSGANGKLAVPEVSLRLSELLKGQLTEASAEDIFFDDLAIRRSWWRGNALYFHGTRLKPRARGLHCKVYDHPVDHRAVVKVSDPQRGARPASNDADRFMHDTASVASVLSALEFGPRLFAVGYILGIEESLPALVQESVFGSTVQRLLRDRRFNQQDNPLIIDLLDRMANGQVETALHLDDIMIGTTPSDPLTRRAYIVDGEFVRFDTRPGLRERLEAQLPFDLKNPYQSCMDSLLV